MLVYLASPYTHPDLEVMEQRFELACAAVAKLIVKGYFVYSPIVHNHSIAIRHALPVEWDFWCNIDEEFIRHFDEFWILMLEGWQKSLGISREKMLAARLGMPIRYIEP
jgi:hypothetical protein